MSNSPTARVSRVWLALMSLTCASAWLLTDGPVSSRVATVGVFLIAGAKARGVILHFMELRDAPTPPRMFFEGTVVAALAVIVAMYAVTS